MTVRDGALSLNKGFSLRTADWAYMRYNDGSNELYDMNADPNQFTNLAEDSDFAMQRRRLNTALTERLRQAGFTVSQKK